MIKNLFKQSGVFFFGSLISKIISTIAWISIARFLAPEKYGQFTLFFTLLQIVTFTADFGLNQYYLKNVDKEGRNSLFNKLLNVRTISLLISSFFIFLLLFLFKTFDSVTTMLFILSLFPMAYLSIAESYYLEQKKGLKVSLKLASISGIFLIGCFIFFKDLNLFKTFFLLFISLTITLFWFFPWKEIKIKSFISLKETFKIFKSSSSYAFLVITSYTYNRGDSLVISYFKGNAALGIYGLAYRFLETFSLFSSSLVQNLFPLSAKKEGLSYKHLTKIILIMFIVGMVFSSFLFFGANLLITSLFGINYLQTINILKIFSLVLLMFFINSPLSTVVQSSKFVNSFLPFGIANTILNILLNIIFVPIYGIFAAAWIMLFTEITGLLINLYFITKLYSNNFSKA